MSSQNLEQIQPINMLGVNFNVSDPDKFSLAIEMLRESTDNLPIFAADNIITWNRNLSFLREDFYANYISNKHTDDIEKSCVWRLYILLYFAESCQKIEGDYLELGCHKGNTAKYLAEKINFKALDKKYWLYDLFSWSEGDAHTHMPGHDNPKMYEDVVKKFSHQSNITVIRGSVPDSFEEGFPSQIAFAHIDMNHPDPESGALRMVLPRLSPRGIVIFDDYGWWGYSAQKKALDPIAAQHGCSILELPTGQGLLLKS